MPETSGIELPGRAEPEPGQSTQAALRLLLFRHIDGLQTRTPSNRQRIYDVARLALSRGPAPAQMREALEGAISDVEADLASSRPPDPVVSPVGRADALPPVDRSRRRFAINAAAGGGSNAVKVGIQLVLLPVMARLLGPEEFGLYALALPAVNFFSVLADAGLGNSLAREDEGSLDVWSTAFWVLLGTGFGLSALVSGWGLILGALAHQPRLPGLMALLSVSFVFITLSVLPSARLTRRGNLVVYAGADATSTVIGAMLAIWLAVSGWGAWSLAVQYVSGYLIRAAFLNAAAFARPALVFRPATLKRHLTTGSAVLGSRLADFAGRLFENLMFGRLFGSAALGNYTFANQVPRFLCEAAQNPVWAALYAHALHAEPSDVAILHRHLVRLLAAVLFPIAFLMSAAAPALVHAVLGDNWAQAAVLMQILVPFYALNAAATQSGAVLLAGGRNVATFAILTGSSLARALAVSAGLWVSPAVIAWGIGLSYVLSALALFAAPRTGPENGPYPLLKSVLSPALAAMAAGLVCHAALMVGPAGGLGWIAVSLALGGGVYLLGMLALEGRQLRVDLGTLRSALKRRGSSSPPSPSGIPS